MELVELTIIVMIAAVTTLIGLGMYYSNRRAIAEFEQRNLNYRAELKQVSSGSYHSSSSDNGEQDILTMITNFAANNPEIVQKFLGGFLDSQNKPGNPPSSG